MAWTKVQSNTKAFPISNRGVKEINSHNICEMCLAINVLTCFSSRLFMLRHASRERMYFQSDFAQLLDVFCINIFMLNLRQAFLTDSHVYSRTSNFRLALPNGNLALNLWYPVLPIVHSRLQIWLSYKDIATFRSLYRQWYAMKNIIIVECVLYVVLLFL